MCGKRLSNDDNFGNSDNNDNNGNNDNNDTNDNNDNNDNNNDVYIYMVAPPSRAYLGRRGMYDLPSVVLNAFRDMLRKHCKFQCFMHILLVLF